MIFVPRPLIIGDKSPCALSSRSCPPSCGSFPVVILRAFTVLPSGQVILKGWDRPTIDDRPRGFDLPAPHGMVILNFIFFIDNRAGVERPYDRVVIICAPFGIQFQHSQNDVIETEL